MIRRLGQRRAEFVGQALDGLGRERGGGVQPGPDRRAAERHLAEGVHGAPGALDPVPDLGGVPAEFLAEPDRRGVLEMGATDLEHVIELGGLGSQRALEMLEAGDQFVLDRLDGGEMDRGRDDVVAGLALVDMVVRVNRRLVAFLAAEQLVGAVGDHLVGVHVGGRAGTGLEDIDGKLGIELAVDHLGGGGDDGGGKFRLDQTELLVDLGGGALDPAHGMDEPRRQRPAADREIGHGALGLHAVVSVRRYFQRTEGIFFGTGFHDGFLNFQRSTNNFQHLTGGGPHAARRG